MRIGLVVPHIFMQDAILPNVIFAPGKLALTLAESLQKSGQDVTLFTPGPVKTPAVNRTADLKYFENELKVRGDDYLSLLRKHPFTFVTLSRQTQSEIIADAISMANDNQLDIIHIFTNEEDIALPMAKLSRKPVIFTHHDPYNFLTKYKNVFPKYANLNWVSLSLAQRRGMPKGTNWIANVYNGLPKTEYRPNYHPTGEYIAYLGRIIHAKGVHLAIRAVNEYNRLNGMRLKLKIAGKHYAGKKDEYWTRQILPELSGDIEYAGYLESHEQRQAFLADSKALIVPSVFEEPFGMVMIEALACATPVIGLRSGAIPEVIKNGQTGLVVDKGKNEKELITNLSTAISGVSRIDRKACRRDFEQRFTSEHMAEGYIKAYKTLIR